MKELVERELASLRLGAEIARIREKRHLSQTQLAARAGMSASKISAMENSPRNVELGTLIRIARALGYRIRPEFIPLSSLD
jgi:transcriptional regulator with XRE-family HTH domain